MQFWTKLKVLGFPIEKGNELIRDRKIVNIMGVNDLYELLHAKSIDRDKEIIEKYF